MFGRGTWAIVGLAKESLEAFRTILEDRATMAGHSQMAASAVTRHFNSDTLGINPFRAPRLDEEHAVGVDHQQELARYTTLAEESRSNHNLPPEILHCEGYGCSEKQFQIHPE